MLCGALRFMYNVRVCVVHVNARSESECMYTCTLHVQFMSTPCNLVKS